MKTIDEVLEVIEQVLIRCVVMGVIVLLFWWGALEFLGNLAYDVHCTLAPMTRQQFDLIHYAGIGLTKLAVTLFFFFPYVAVRLVIKKREKEKKEG